MDVAPRCTRRFGFLAIVGVIAILAAGMPVGFFGASTARAGVADGPPTITTFWVTNVTQTQATLYMETDQPAEGYVDYGATPNLGRVRPRSAPPQQTRHTILITNLSPDKVYYARARAVNEFGQDTNETFTFRTPAASSTAKLVVTKQNTSGSTLVGACFAVYTDAGGGAMGALLDSECDRYDTAPNNGQVVFPALPAGAVVLVEFRSPDGYSLPRKTRLTLTAGQTKNHTVTDSRGGARITITKRDEQDRLVPGACFSALRIVNGQITEPVAWGCDDYDSDDGITTLGNLGAGTYWLRETYTPPGHLSDRGREITIVSGQRALAVAFLNTTREGKDNVEFQALSSAGALLPGACFVLFSGGAYYGDQCDWDDGDNDGRTFFSNVAPGTYDALEYRAPSGYLVGKTASFTKVDDRFKRLRYTQTAGGAPVTVTTVKGSTSSRLSGACYALFRKVSSGPWPAVAFSCDWEDGADDGVTRFAGLKSGTYLLEQYATPPGFAKPQNREIMVGASGSAVTVRNAAGVSAASVSDGMVPSVVPPATNRVTPVVTATPTTQPTPIATPTTPAVAQSPVATETVQPAETPTTAPVPTDIPNASPVANAGPDQVVVDADGNGTEAVTLDGTGSADPDGSELTFTWSLNGTVIATTAAFAIELPAGTHAILLVVTDPSGATSTDDVVVTIAPAPAAEPPGADSAEGSGGGA